MVQYDKLCNFSYFQTKPLRRFAPLLQTLSVGVIVRRRPSQSQRLEYLENGLTLNQENVTGTSVPTCSTAIPDMASLTTSGHVLS